MHDRAQRLVLHGHQNYFHFYQKHHWCSCRVCKHWLESTPSHEIATQQNHDHFPLWHVFPHFDHLQIGCMAHVYMGRYSCWLDVYSIWIAGEWVCGANVGGIKIIHQTKMGCLGSDGFKRVFLVSVLGLSVQQFEIWYAYETNLSALPTTVR